MPKIVDHAERRRELARAALRVIGRGGLESATTRAIAEESGWSTGVLKHYFADKDALLHGALAELERLNVERLERAQQQPDGLEAIRAAVTSILRSDPGETRVWIAFTARASVDPATATAMLRSIEVWVRRWAGLVERGQQDGSIRADVVPRRVAIELYALVNGLRLHDHFRRQSVPGRRDLGADLSLLEGLRP